MNKQEIIIYKTKDNKIELETKLENETIWLTQAQMALLFDRERSVITKHLNNVFEEGELKEKSNVQNLHIGGSDKPVKYYSLDTIISVGYRVKSINGTRFRIWATKVLRDHIIHGYTINEKRLKEQREKFLDLQNAVKTLTSVISKKELTGKEATGILQVLSDYNYALDILDQYDHEKLKVTKVTKKDGYKILYDDIRKLIDEMGVANNFSELFGKERDESFRSSISTIYQSIGGKELYPSVEEKAANLLYFIVKNHSFVDGNKRIAAFIFVWFLDRNEILYDESKNKRVADNALVALTLLIAESNPREKDTIVKIIVNLINKEN